MYFVRSLSRQSIEAYAVSVSRSVLVLQCVGLHLGVLVVDTKRVGDDCG